MNYVKIKPQTLKSFALGNKIIDDLEEGKVYEFTANAGCGRIFTFKCFFKHVTTEKDSSIKIEFEWGSMNYA
jgi:hypothetical protein